MYIETSSSQKSIFFKFTTLNQKELANLAAQDTKHFHRYLTSILSDQYSNVGELTILEKFLILLQLRIFYVGSLINVPMICPQCEGTVSFSKNLVNDIAKFEIFDKDFSKIFQDSGIEIKFDIPKIKEELDLLNDISENWKFMFVQKIKIQHSPPHATTEINLEDFSFSERKQIVENLDAHLTKPLNDYFNQILNLNIPNYIHAKCSHCPHTISHDLNIVNMYFFIKNILFDFNYIEILADIANISANLHLSGEFLLGTTPMERLNYKSFIKKDEDGVSPSNYDNDSPESVLSQNTEFGFSH